MSIRTGRKPNSSAYAFSVARKASPSWTTRTGNDGNGINYDDAGIAAVAASVLNVLTVAQDTDHQYVMADSATVDYKPYSYLVANYAEDVRKRNLPLISGRYARMNALHTVVQVSLLVTL